MALALHNNRGNAVMAAIAALELAGYTREQVREALLSTGGHIQRAARTLGRHAVNALREFDERNRQRRRNIRDDNMGQTNPNAYNQLNRHREDVQRNEVSQSNSLRTSEAPAPTPSTTAGGMERGHEAQNMHGAPEEGGEDQTGPIKNVWKRFPNTQNTQLKWLATLWLGPGVAGIGAGSSAINNEPFDISNDLTSTSLSTTGGTALSNPSSFDMYTPGNGYNFDNPFLIQLRMTSPYNIIKNFGGNTNAKSTPMWRGIFDTKYTYYHCLETEWELKGTFGVPNTQTAAGPPAVFSTLPRPEALGFYIFWKYTEQDDPPTNWSGLSGGKPIARQIGQTDDDHVNIQALDAGANPGTVSCTPDDYFRMGGWHHKHVKLNATHLTEWVIRGKYKYGQCKMDIKTISPNDAHGTDTAAEGWTQVNSTPVFPENLSVVIVYDNMYRAIGSGANPTLTPCAIRMETEQLVQWKDLRKGYKFPVPGYVVPNPDATYLNTDLVYFMEGAGYT